MITIPVSNMHNLWTNPFLQNYGQGADGIFTTGSYPAVEDVYTDLTAGAASLSDSLTVRNSSSFTIGDEVMIHQSMIGDSGVLADRGIYEFGVVLAIPNGTTITLSTPLVNTYVSDPGGNSVNLIKAQVLKVWNYSTITNPTLALATPRPWDGYSGGILAFRALTLTGTGDIDASGKGFRGAPAGSPRAGEGWRGISTNQYTNTGSGGIGSSTGIGPAPTTSGGGGGHNGVGESGDGAGGGTYALPELSTNLNLGGGGGTVRLSSSDFSGGDSGGIILAFIEDHAGYSGTIKSNGAEGQPTGGGRGGVGSGGAVLVHSGTPYGGTVEASGIGESDAGSPDGAPGYVIQTL